jgi:hypothetical protein
LHVDGRPIYAKAKIRIRAVLPCHPLQGATTLRVDLLLLHNGLRETLTKWMLQTLPGSAIVGGRLGADVGRDADMVG